MAYRKSNGRYVAIVCVDGKRTTRTFSTKALAEAAERPHKLNKQRIQAGIVTQAEMDESVKGEITIEVAADEWNQYLFEQSLLGRITKPWATERHRCGVYAANLLGLLTINQINYEKVALLICKCEENGLSRAATVKYVQGLRELQRFTLKGAKRQPVKTERRQNVRALTSTEIMRLLALNTDRTLFYAGVLFTGVRWRELQRVRASDWDIDKAIIFLQKDATKSHRDDPIPMPSIVADYICSKDRRIGQAPLFGKEPTRKQWLRDLKAAKIEHTTDEGVAMKKACRKTFQTMLRAANIQTETRKLLMRHIDGLADSASYTDRMRLMPTMTEGVEKMVSWYLGQLMEAVG